MGGSERLLTSFAASCAESPGLPQVFVVINDKINAYLAESLAATGHPVYFLKRPPGQRNPRIVLTLLNIMRRHDVRMIHAHDTGAKHFAMLSKLYRPMSVGYTIHNTGLVPAWDGVKVRLHRRFVDWNIAISAAVARECEAARLQRIFKVHNAIPLASFCAPVRLLQPDAPIRLINVARLYPRQKGQDILIEAIGILRKRGLDIHCDFVGDPPEGDREMVPALQRLAAAEGISDRIRFLCDRTDIPALLGDADVFVLPSRFEGFGLVLLEAMAAGVPVVAADVDGPAELLVDGSNGIKFKACSAEDLADKIAALVANPEAAARIATTAQHFVTEFDIANMREQYFAIYRQMMQMTKAA